MTLHGLWKASGQNTLNCYIEELDLKLHKVKEVFSSIETLEGGPAKTENKSGKKGKNLLDIKPAHKLLVNGIPYNRNRFKKSEKKYFKMNNTAGSINTKAWSV